MTRPRLSKLELRIMEVFWDRGILSIREVQEAFPKKNRPAYTTIQTTIYRLEAKSALRRVKKISNAHMFEAVITRGAAHRRLLDEILSLFGGSAQPVMTQLIESGKLTLQDVDEARKALQDLARKEKR